MIGIYLGAFEASHPNYNIVYQDINGKRDVGGDMCDVKLDYFDFIICTPPCNYWSKARGRRISQYSKDTKHLLPYMINRLIHIGKPFIIENVRNDKRFKEEMILPENRCFVLRINRHTYFTNVAFDISDIEQRQDFKYGGKVIKYDDMTNKKHQGGFNVHNVIESWLKTVNSCKLCVTMHTLEDSIFYTYVPFSNFNIK